MMLHAIVMYMPVLQRPDYIHVENLIVYVLLLLSVYLYVCMFIYMCIFIRYRILHIHV